MRLNRLAYANPNPLVSKMPVQADRQSLKSGVVIHPDLRILNCTSQSKVVIEIQAVVDE